MKLTKAMVYSVILHLLVIVLLATNVSFNKIEVSKGRVTPQINARAIDSKRVNKLVEQLRKLRNNKRNEEQKRLDELIREQDKAKQKRRQEEKKAEDARKRRIMEEKKRKAEERKAADARKKRISQEQARKKKAEVERKRKAEQERKRKAEAERQRKAEAKRKRDEAEKKRKAEARRQQELERQMQEQMDAEATELAAAHQAQVMSEVDKYNLLIKNKIKRNWIAPEQKGSCVFRISIAPGGLVLGITVLRGDNQHCESGRRAINKSEPLPMSSDPDVVAILKTRTFELENINDKNEYNN